MALNLWTGHGIWQGWSIRKHYEKCKFGESVLVDPNGNAYYPDDIISLKDDNVNFDICESKRSGEQEILGSREQSNKKSKRV